MTGTDGPAARPLVVTDDLDLLDDLLRLAAAAAVEVEVAADAAAARRAWTAAPLVLVGEDLAAALAATAPPRRRDVVLCSIADEPSLWHRAVDLGAERVVAVAGAETWLVERLADAVGGPSREAPVVAVTGGCGGAGASLLATGLALAAGRAGRRALLVDADPLGGGLDLLLAAEHEPGLRWSDLAAAAGRLAPGELERALPRGAGLPVLAWDPAGPSSVPVAAMRAVLDAGRRGFDVVVVDVPRRPAAAAREALLRAEATLLVVPRDVRAVAAAARVAQLLGEVTATVRLVTRGPAPTGLTAADVAHALRLPLLADVRADRSLPAAVDRGEQPGRRGPLAAACDTLAAELWPSPPSLAAA